MTRPDHPLTMLFRQIIADPDEVNLVVDAIRKDEQTRRLLAQELDGDKHVGVLTVRLPTPEADGFELGDIVSIYIGSLRDPLAAYAVVTTNRPDLENRGHSLVTFAQCDPPSEQPRHVLLSTEGDD